MWSDMKQEEAEARQVEKESMLPEEEVEVADHLTEEIGAHQATAVAAHPLVLWSSGTEWKCSLVD